ncbi:MAG TPA: SRPBCC family protein, partial [Gemmataceae bacterium]|nr:SRPBCC family protein [Gemmataceae bacterium]
ERLTELLEAFDPTLPLARAHTIPSSWYFDAELADLERRTVFAGWQAVGRCDQLAQPGSYLTAEVAGEPVAVVRDEAGVLRAFHNVCRHRAAPVLTEPCGQATKLRCRYHGWTYDLAGRLRGAPEFDGVADFCRDDFGLTPMIADTWGPTVWVHPQSAALRLADFLHPLPERAEPGGIAQLKWHARRTYDLACNWKVYVDNFLDGGYHVNSVHPGLAGVLDYGHYRTELHASASVQIAPLRPADAVEGVVRLGDTAYYWWVFPNFMVNLYAGVMDTNLVLPLGPEGCRVVFDFYFAEDTQAEFVEQSVAVAEQVQKEDIGICEEVQRGLRSRAFTTGRFSVRRENGGYHFHQLLARALRAGLSDEGQPARA